MMLLVADGAAALDIIIFFRNLLPRYQQQTSNCSRGTSTTTYRNNIKAITAAFHCMLPVVVAASITEGMHVAKEMLRLMRDACILAPAKFQHWLESSLHHLVFGFASKRKRRNTFHDGTFFFLSACRY